MSQPRPHLESAAIDPTRWKILAVLLTAIFMSLMSVSVVNVALVSIQDGLHADLSDIQWILSGYALTFGVVLVSAGRAGDLMGRGGFFILGVLIFTLASIAAGFAPNADWLNTARFVQGVGSGLINPQGIGMIQQYFQGAERGKAFGFFGTAVGVSVAIGPALGGLLIHLGGTEIGWRLTFLINVPAGILTLVLAWLWFPRPLLHKPCLKNQSSLVALDPIGALLLGLAVLAVLFPFVGSDSLRTYWYLLPSGFVLVFIWLFWERWYTKKGYSPLVNLKIFTIASYRNGALIMTLYFFGMTSIWVLIPLYVQQSAGLTALEAGLIGIPSALLSAVSSNWAGRKVKDYGRKIVVAGLCIAITGLLLNIAVVLLYQMFSINIWWMLLTLTLFGIGQGLVVSPNQTLTLAEVPISYAGSSGAIMQTGQRIGTSIGIAAVTALVFGLLPYTSWHVAVIAGFIAIILFLLLALSMAIKDLRDRVKQKF